jgi:uncharacterized membrane protein
MSKRNGAVKDWARRAYRFAKTTVIGGLVFLVPVFVLIWLSGKAAKLLRRLAQPLDALVPLERIYGVLIADAIAVAVLIVICFIGGLLARASIGGRFIKKAESGVLWYIPGYGLIRAMADSLDRNGAQLSMRPVLIHFDDAAQLAFEVDRLPDGRRVIYVPSAPEPRSGSVIVMDADRVEEAPLTFVAAMRSLRAVGRGLGKAWAAGRPPAAKVEAPTTAR